MRVSWHDSVAYCEWISKKTGQNYRLPTEAEWEYACRKDTTTKWSFGDDEKELEKYAWYDKNSEKKTHPVGELKSNPWGLYDMHGNVYEWCEDWYDKDKDRKSLLAVRGSMMISSLAPLSVTGAVLLVVAMMLGFVSSELYLSFWLFFTFGFFALVLSSTATLRSDRFGSVATNDKLLSFASRSSPRRDATNFLNCTTHFFAQSRVGRGVLSPTHVCIKKNFHI